MRAGAPLRAHFRIAARNRFETWERMSGAGLDLMSRPELKFPARAAALAAIRLKMSANRLLVVDVEVATDGVCQVQV